MLQMSKNKTSSLFMKQKNTGDKITSIGRGEIEGRALWGIIVWQIILREIKI
jgi:hypothetical protein